MKYSLILLIALISTSLNYETEQGVLILGQDDFDQAVEEFPYLLVVGVHSTCDSCKDIDPLFKQGAQIIRETATFAIINDKKGRPIQTRYNINGGPHYLFFEKGEVTYNRMEIICRNAECFATWIYQRIFPPATQLKDNELESFLEQTPRSLVYFTDNVKDRDYKRFLDAAQQYPGKQFAHALDKTAKKTYGSLVAFDGIKKHIAFQGEQKQARIKIFIENWIYGRLGNSERIVDKIFKYERNAMILILKSEDKTSEEQFIQASNQLPLEDQLFTLILKQSDSEYQNYIQKLGGVEYEQTTLLITNKNGQNKFVHQGEINTESIIQFVKDFQSGRTTKFFKNQPINKELQEQYKHLTFLNGLTYEKEVIHDEKDVIVLFYDPNEDSTKKLTDTFNQLALKLSPNKNIKVCAIDIQNNEVEEFPIGSTGFPKIQFYKKGSKGKPAKLPVKSAALKVDRIVIFAQENTSFPWVRTDL